MTALRTFLSHFVWAIVIFFVVRAAWRDATRSDARDREDDALRKFGPMD